MTQIKAADVSKLRKMTGAGMMDCKAALQEANGDFDQAIEILRKKGQKIATKRADREAAEGAVLAKVSADAKIGALLVVNCETDFVAKNEDFVSFVQSLIDLSVNENVSSIDELKGLSLNGVKVNDVLLEQIGKIGEKLDISAFEKIEAEQVFAYIHPGNKLASIAGFNKTTENVQLGKDVVMQIAAMNPIAVDKDDVPSDVIEKEIEIGKEQARQEGKPEQMLEKIAVGKLNKFYKESTLLNQESVKVPKTTMRQLLQTEDKELTVTGFKRITLNQ